jgi:hypothetical protein
MKGMPVPAMQYPDNETAARAVFDAIKVHALPVRHLALHSAGARWTAVRRQAAFDEWRLVPANTPGPHRHGRLAFRRVPETPNLMSAGFGATRGLGRQLAELANPALMMDGSWFWRNRLVGDVFAGALDTPIRAVMAATGQPVFVALELIRFDALPELGGTPVLPPYPADRLVFRIRDDAQSLSAVVLPEHELSPLATSPALRDLVLHAEALPDLWWAWIDLHIGVRVAYADEDVPGAWDANELWSRALAPWLPWVH